MTDDPSGHNDGRPTGDHTSRYDSNDWHWIKAEAAYLAATLILALVLITLLLGEVTGPNQNAYSRLAVGFFGSSDGTFFSYLLIFKFGLVGGCVFDIKWLIHSVARNEWHRDRVLWRLFVPWTSGVTAAVFAIVVQSGLIALFEKSSFSSLQVAAAFGFLVGYFSDGVIGVLGRIAEALFGTLHDRRGR